jgi:hypothetical protein
MHFTTNGQTLAPFYIADPDSPPTSPYHMYVRRHEPAIVFGSSDSGVPNYKRDSGLTFLDTVWDEAPFATRAALRSTVDRVATEWLGRGLLMARERLAILEAADKASFE